MKHLLLALAICAAPAWAQKQTVQDTSGFIHPKIEAADAGQAGVAIPGGYTQAGIGFSGCCNPSSPFIVNIVNNGDDDAHPDSQSVTLRLWSRGNSVGGTDNGIEGFTANGTFASPTHTKAGDKLLKLSGFGYATTGFAQNDSAVINFKADQDFSNTGSTPLEANTASGGCVSVETASLGGNAQVVRGQFDSVGNLAIGSFPSCGNGFTDNGAAIILKDGSSPASGLSNAGILSSVAGKPYWHDHSAPHQVLPYTCQWNASGSLVRGFGIASVTKNGTGDFTITFSNAYADADSFVPMFFGQGHYSFAGKAANSVRVQSFDSYGNFKDFDVNYCVIHG